MPDTEFNIVRDSLAALFLNWRTGTLLLLLLVAAVSDYRSRRIPNWLVLSGSLFGVIYNTAFPASPGDNILFSLAGFGLGMAMFLPLYLLRAMGAGDVKLVAMVGAFLGPVATLHAGLASMMVGGVLSIVFVLVRGAAPRMFRNLASLFQLGFLNAVGGSAPNLRISAETTAGRLPYGVAIAIGTIGYLMLHRSGYL